jgi:AcrR family transcriptional regulator
MPRVGLDAEAVVVAAAALADSEGLGSVTLARLAGELGIRPPSLYAHIASLDDLRRRIGAHAAAQLGAALGAAAAGRARADALRAIAAAYRDYAHAHPGSYAALQRAPDRDDDATRQAYEAVVAVVLAVLRGYGLEADEAIHATRSVRAALHGFVALEADQGFGIPLSLDESFDRLVAVLDRGLTVEGPVLRTATR